MVIMRHPVALATALLLVAAQPCAAEAEVMSRGFVPLPFAVEGVKRTAALHVPPGYDASKTWPLIVYLHGGGGNGDRVDEAWARRHPIVRAAKEHPERFPALILVPRCPRGKIWAPLPPDPVQSAWRLRRHGRKPAPDAAAHVTAAIDAAVAAYAVDEDRITLTGHSMGGEGSTRYAALHPDRFAAVAPSAGSAVIVLDDAARLAQMGVWILQGENDRISTAALARRMVAAIRAAGGEPRYTEYKGAGHATAYRAYSDPKLIEWLLKQRKRRRPTTPH
jgi:predicted peptidase